jgi:glycosyltransferase involved in cell wall biosynthesis
MPTKSLISVIIPTYNFGEFISNAINSVLCQTYKNIEIILIDDGSTDDTTQIATQFGNKICYIKTDHIGTAHARNVGMRAATGKYIAFMDADDTYLPYKLELQSEFMECYPEVGMVFTDWSSVDDSGTILEDRHLRSYHRIYDRKGWNYEDIFSISGKFDSNILHEPIRYYIGNLFKYVIQDPIMPSPTIMIRKDILPITGLQNEAYRVAQDYEFTVRICKFYQTAFLEVPTYLYRYHPKQVSMHLQSWSKEKIETALEIHRVFLQAVLDWAYADKEYYEANTSDVNLRLAELYHVIGEINLEHGASRKARQCFKQALSFVPGYTKSQSEIFLSFFPLILQRRLRRIFNCVSLGN